MSGMADQVLDELTNPELSTNQKLASLRGIKEAMQISLLGKQESRADAMLKLQQDELLAKLNSGKNQVPQGTFMSRQEFSSLLSSGVPAKGVPTADGRIYVTDISGNQPGVLGSNVALIDGKPVQLPAQKLELPAWGGVNNADTAAAGIIDGINMGETTPLPVDGAVLPPLPDQTQNVQQGIPLTEVPKGDVWRMDRDGLVAGQIPGSMQDLEAQQKRAQIQESESKAAQARSEASRAETAKIKSEKQEIAKTNFIIDKANEAEQIIRQDISEYGVGSAIDIAKATVPGTSAYKLQKQILPALKDAIALDNLRRLKENSPTGSSGLGSVTEKEGQRLENMYGVLNVGGDKDILLKDITRLKEEVFNTVHGTKAERNKALREGKITAEQNNQVEQMYNEQILGMKAQPQLQDNVGISPEVEQMLKDLGL